MKVSRFEVNAFCENTYILWSEPGGDAIIVDPGMMKPHEHEAVNGFIATHDLHVTHILLTHAHLDHVFAARDAATRYGAPVCAGRGEVELARAMPQQALRFGYHKLQVEPLTIDRFLDNGDELTLAGERIVVFHTPGHSPGGLSFHLPSSEVVITGDTIFYGSIGRTDLPGGDHHQLIASIRARILTLPQSTLIAPGHDGTTTVAHEAVHNPFLR